MQDILGRPAKVGDTVLTKGYYSATLNTISTIKRVNKKSVTIEVTAHTWSKIPDSSHPNGYRWGYVKTNDKPMKRDSDSFIIINEQLAYNKATWPEYYI